MKRGHSNPLVICFRYRGRVYNEEPLLVHFLDTGFRNKPEVMKVLPSQFKKYPAYGIRVVINSPEALEKNIVYDITVIKKVGENFD